MFALIQSGVVVDIGVTQKGPDWREIAEEQPLGQYDERHWEALDDGTVHGVARPIPIGGLAEIKRAEIAASASSLQESLLGTQADINRRLAEYLDLLPLALAGVATETERVRIAELLGIRSQSEEIDRRAARCNAEIDAALAADDRDSLLAVIWAG